MVKEVIQDCSFAPAGMKALQGVPDVIVEGQPSWTMVGEEAAGAAGSAGAGSAGAGSAGAGSAGAGSAGASIETGGMSCDVASVQVKICVAFSQVQNFSVVVESWLLSVTVLEYLHSTEVKKESAGKTVAQESPVLGGEAWGGHPELGGAMALIFTHDHAGAGSVAVQVHAAFVTVVTFMISVSMISPPQPPLAIPAGKTPAQDSPSLGTPGRARQNSGMEELEPVGAGALTRDGVGMVAIGAGTGAGTGEEATTLMTLVHWLETPPLQMYLFSPLRQLQIWA